MTTTHLKAFALGIAITAPALAFGQTDTFTPTGAAADLGFVQAIAHDDDDFYGQLPDGTWFEVKYDDNRLEEIDASAGGTIPADLLDRLLPESVRTNAQLTALARVTQIEIDSDGDIEIDGYDSANMRVELEFDASGTLDEAKTSPDDRRSLDVAAATARLTEEGFTDIDWAERSSREIEVIARNAAGDLVMVRLDENGQINRERALR